MEKLKTILAEALSVPKESITLDSSPESIKSWDSMRGLLIVTRLEEAYGLSFTLDEVLSVRTVVDIVSILELHGITFKRHE